MKFFLDIFGKNVNFPTEWIKFFLFLKNIII